MSRATLILAVFALGCSPAAEDDVEPALPAFVDDCAEGANEGFDTLSGLPGESATFDAEICGGDEDWYVLEVPSGAYVSVEIDIDGSGAGATDLDLWQVDNPADPADPGIDFVDEEGDLNVLWYSATEREYERLAFYNPGDEPVLRYLMVDGYKGAEAAYTLRVVASEYTHAERDCDDAYDDSPEEGGPCNRILQYPQAITADEGFLVTHEARYSNLRREVAYLVRFAAEETAATFADTKPLALMDMSERNGDTPGYDDDQPRHPEGTHVEGNDIDIAYYQNGDDNYGRAVCPNDGYFCTGAPNQLDARRTAFFLAKLFSSPNVRVIGVDTKIAEEVQDAARDLKDEGLIGNGELNKILGWGLAYGDGWPFHHHHLHLSWNWESGFEERAAPPVDGCMHAEAEPAPRRRAWARR